MRAIMITNRLLAQGMYKTKIVLETRPFGCIRINSKEISARSAIQRAFYCSVQDKQSLTRLAYIFNPQLPLSLIACSAYANGQPINNLCTYVYNKCTKVYKASTCIRVRCTQVYTLFMAFSVVFGISWIISINLLLNSAHRILGLHSHPKSSRHSQNRKPHTQTVNPEKQKVSAAYAPVLHLTYN